MEKSAKIIVFSIISILISCLLICILKIYPVKHEKKIPETYSQITCDTTFSNNNIIVVNQSGNGSQTSIIEINSRKNDPQIKAEQDIHFMDGEYACITMGWDHGNITYSSYQYHIPKEQLRKVAKEEKTKCEHFLYGKDGEEINRIKNQ